MKEGWGRGAGQGYVRVRKWQDRGTPIGTQCNWMLCCSREQQSQVRRSTYQQMFSQARRKVYMGSNDPQRELPAHESCVLM